MSTTAAPKPAARRGDAPRTLYDRVADLLPTWAWLIVFATIGIGYGVLGQDLFGESLYDSMITTLAFVIMALGLNIVVGFAGLLDLGYVAFYAIGAFVAGWLMSSHFGEQFEPGIHIGVSEVTTNLPGLHINFILVLVISAAFTAAVMGGIGNLQGAVLGGLIIGCVQQISDNRIGSEWTPAVVFAYLVLVMVFRPQGLLGEQTREAG